MSLSRLLNQTLHFDTERVLTAGITLQGSSYESDSQKDLFWERLLVNVARIPGVEAASLSSQLPLEGGSNANFLFEGEEYDPELNRSFIAMNDITPQYFSALGIPLLAGRCFIEEDIGTESFGVIVNRALADRYWPDEDPVGKRIYPNSPAPEFVATVVGVSEDVRQYGLTYQAQPEIYFPFSQYSLTNANLVLKTSGDPRIIIPPLREALESLDPHLPLSRIRTMDQVIDGTLARRRFTTTLIGLFAVVALCLMLVGVFGATSYHTTTRTHELGIRAALGARRGSLIALIMGNGLTVAITGLVIGLGGVFLTGSFSKNILFGIHPTQPVVLIGVAGITLLIAGLGSLLPALRAVRGNLASVLRNDA
jgi:predicted permease